MHEQAQGITQCICVCVCVGGIKFCSLTILQFSSLVVVLRNFQSNRHLIPWFIFRNSITLSDLRIANKSVQDIGIFRFQDLAFFS